MNHYPGLRITSVNAVGQVLNVNLLAHLDLFPKDARCTRDTGNDKGPEKANAFAGRWPFRRRILEQYRLYLPDAFPFQT
jgi:hypothetical protein